MRLAFDKVIAFPLNIVHPNHVQRKTTPLVYLLSLITD